MFDNLFGKHGLSLERLKSFIEVVEAGSIAEAVDREPSRQSLVSRQIRELESYFELQLTERQGKGLRITDDGQELARISREFLHQIQDFRLQAKGRKATLRIGAGFSTMQWIITPRACELGKLLDASLEMRRMKSREAPRLLGQGEIDFAVVRQDAIPDGDPRFDSLPLGNSGYSLFSSDENPEAPMAIPTGGGQLEAKLTEAIRDQSQPCIRCGSLLQVASLVIDGQARAVLPDIASRGFRRMTWIKQAPYPPLEDYSRAWCLAWSKHQMETRGISQAKLKAAANLLKISAS